MFKSIILGAPASGKGTISAKIVKTFNIYHISSGDELRMHIKNKTDIGLNVAKYIDGGLLVPDDLMIKLIINKIKVIDNKKWLLDGFPRTLLQANRLWEIEKLDSVINLNVPYEIIMERAQKRWIHLSSGRVYNLDFNAPKVHGKDDITGEDLTQRSDDKPEILLKRLKQYENMTRPVIDFYKSKGILQEFKGNTSNEIWDKLTKYLYNVKSLNTKQ